MTNTKSVLNNVCKKAVILCSLFYSSALFAQQYQFVNLTTDDGLVQSQVVAMVQDKRGYIWFATYGGLSRFDGKNFQNYGIENGLASNQVHALFIDSKEKIWIGYAGSVGYFHNNVFHTVALHEEVNQSRVTSFCEDQKGRIWVSFEDEGVGYIENNMFFLPDESGINGFQVRSVHCTESHQLYAATSNGVFIWNENDRKFYPAANKILSRVSASYITSRGDKVYIATFGNGIFCLRNDSLTRYDSDNGLIEDHIRNLFIDSRGEIWAASISGLSHIRHGKIINLTLENGLLSENIKFVSEDNEGNIWMGTDGKGVLKFAGESFVAYTVTDGMGSEPIMSILQDKEGNYWFSTYGKGVVKYNGVTYTHFTDADGLTNNVVWTSCEGKDGKLYFGTSDGLSVYDGRKFTEISDTTPNVSSKITSLLAEEDGRIWIGRRTGLSCLFPNGSIKHYDARDGLHGGNVRSIKKDGKKGLWLGGASGLHHFDGKKFRLFKPNPRAEDNAVYCIEPFGVNHIWVGTNTGLYLFDGKKFHKLFLSENPNANNVNFLLRDGTGVWVGTNSGIFEIFPADHGTIDRVTVIAYTKYEGLRGTETNMNACYKDKALNLWFATNAGLVRYDRSLDKQRAASVPFMHINDVRVFFEKPNWQKYARKTNKTTLLPVHPKVPYNKNHFTFYFTGISHTNPLRLRYVFKLDGFDENWSPLTEADFTTYSNLPHGDYTFRVKCVNRDGLWSKEAVFSFTIIPPYWRTWWFLVLCIMGGLVIVFLVWRWRVAVLKRKNKTLQLYYRSKLLSLEQQSLNASMNRHFIFNSLNSIQYYINKQDKLEANRYLTNFAKLIRKNLDSSVNGENMVSLNEELERIKLYLSLEMMRFKDRFTYELSVSPEVNADELKIPPMLLQPYIENSIWHGILPTEGEGKIEIRIFPHKFSTEKVCIEILDDGIGISTSMARKVNSGSTHISRGIEITSGRLNLLKQMTSQDLEIHGPEDIIDNQGVVRGTRVFLVLNSKPLMKNELTNQKFSEKSFEF